MGMSSVLDYECSPHFNANTMIVEAFHLKLTLKNILWCQTYTKLNNV